MQSNKEIKEEDVESGLVLFTKQSQGQTSARARFLKLKMRMCEINLVYYLIHAIFLQGKTEGLTSDTTVYLQEMSHLVLKKIPNMCKMSICI